MSPESRDVSLSPGSGTVDILDETNRYGDLIAQRVNTHAMMDMTGGQGPDLPSSGRDGMEMARLFAAKNMLEDDEVAELVAVRHDYLHFGIGQEAGQLVGTTPGVAYIEGELYMEDPIDVSPGGRQRSGFTRQQPAATGGFGTGGQDTDGSNSLLDPGGGGVFSTWVTTPDAEASVYKFMATLNTSFADAAAGYGGGGSVATWPSAGWIYNLRDQWGRGPFFGPDRGQETTGHDLTLGNALTWTEIDNLNLWWKHGVTVFWDIFERVEAEETLELRES